MNVERKTGPRFLFLVENEQAKVGSVKLDYLHKYMSKYDSRGLDRRGIEFSTHENPKDQVLTKMKADPM